MTHKDAVEHVDIHEWGNTSSLDCSTSRRRRTTLALRRVDHPAAGKGVVYVRLLGLLLSRKAETLFVAQLDRFSRRGAQAVLAVVDQVEKVRGRIVFVADGLDTRRAL
jgi:site-specific DNA recombinase